MAQTPDSRVLFNEWQLPNFTSFLPNLLFAPAVWLVFAPINQTLGTIDGLALTGLSIALRLFVAKRIVVTQSSIKIGSADIPRIAIGNAVSIAAENQFAERGARLHSRAFLALKSGLPGLVKVEITDEGDETPYLLISTRRPEELISSLKS
jgi:hypothetical protein